jgi:uncharacterized protein YbjT (DUF2867 family)
LRELPRAAGRSHAPCGRWTTVIRPGALTDDPGTGTITVRPDIGGRPIPRDDVAATIAAVLDTPATSGLVLDLRGGGLQIAQALAQLRRS